jgi:ParB/RepB/Spo0J family partition protein
VSEENGEHITFQTLKDHQPDRIEPNQPEDMIVKLEAINEPELAARCTMSEHDMSEMIDSLDTLGQLSPITLMRKGERFEIIDGHRRYLAAGELNSNYAAKGEVRWTCLRAEVYPEGDPLMLAKRLHANIIREQLNPAEEAIFMRQAMEQYGLDLEGLCKLFHRSESYINSRFSLVYGDEKILYSVLHGKINLGAAQQLNRIKDEKWRHHYLDCAEKTSPPGSVVQNWVREWEKMKPYLDQQQQVTAEPQPQPEPEVHIRACALCGGYKDQGNLIEVTFHKHEWEMLEAQIRKAQGLPA